MQVLRSLYFTTDRQTSRLALLLRPAFHSALPCRALQCHTPSSWKELRRRKEWDEILHLAPVQLFLPPHLTSPYLLSFSVMRYSIPPPRRRRGRSTAEAAAVIHVSRYMELSSPSPKKTLTQSCIPPQPFWSSRLPSFQSTPSSPHLTLPTFLRLCSPLPLPTPSALSLFLTPRQLLDSNRDGWNRSDTLCAFDRQTLKPNTGWNPANCRPPWCLAN
ncbi:hypothetical protein LY78DRAFT_708917 [Colletotrichum sublineola]|nr:hypothetical protein LY78DRAFT_708917 [Colletotrichum sublineola]